MPHRPAADRICSRCRRLLTLAPTTSETAWEGAIAEGHSAPQLLASSLPVLTGWVGPAGAEHSPVAIA
jgi:hypothetical protein